MNLVCICGPRRQSGTRQAAARAINREITLTHFRRFA